MTVHLVNQSLPMPKQDDCTNTHPHTNPCVLCMARSKVDFDSRTRTNHHNKEFYDCYGYWILSHDFSHGDELINTLSSTLWQKSTVFGQGQEDHFRHKKPVRRNLDKGVLFLSECWMCKKRTKKVKTKRGQNWDNGAGLFTYKIGQTGLPDAGSSCFRSEFW